jgi:hypothetical protein
MSELARQLRLYTQHAAQTAAAAEEAAAAAAE